MDNKVNIRNIDENYKYLNFPVTILKHQFPAIKTVCEEAISYGILNQLSDFSMEGQSLEESAKLVAEHFGVSELTPERLILVGAKVASETPPKPPFAGIRASMLKEYLVSNKTELDIACFRAYIAIRSILGNEPVKKITNDHLLARMFGYSSASELPPESERTGDLKKYSSQYYLRKIRNELVLNWHLKCYAGGPTSGVRGFYVSFQMNHRSLVTYATKQKLAKKNRDKKKIESLKKIEKEVLMELNAIAG